jgi:hypothetical protein
LLSGSGVDRDQRRAGPRGSANEHQALIDDGTGADERSLRIVVEFETPSLLTGGSIHGLKPSSRDVHRAVFERRHPETRRRQFPTDLTRLHSDRVEGLPIHPVHGVVRNYYCATSRGEQLLL